MSAGRPCVGLKKLRNKGYTGQTIATATVVVVVATTTVDVVVDSHNPEAQTKTFTCACHFLSNIYLHQADKNVLNCIFFVSIANECLL